MIIRYSFPVPKQGTVRNMLLYTETSDIPSQDRLKHLLTKLKRKAKRQRNWNKYIECKRSIFAVDNVVSNWPINFLKGMDSVPIICDTQLRKRSAIQMTVVHPLSSF